MLLGRLRGALPNSKIRVKELGPCILTYACYITPSANYDNIWEMVQVQDLETYL